MKNLFIFFSSTVLLLICIYSCQKTNTPVPLSKNTSLCLDVNKYSHLTSLDKIDLSRWQHKFIVSESEVHYQCDANRTLQELFTKVTVGSKTQTAAVKKWVTYIQTITFHPRYEALDNNGLEIDHPIWLLENHGGWCSQISRLIVDGLRANGYQARVIQLNGHQAAEVYLDKKWHYLEADIIGYGQFIYNKDGEIASVTEIVHNPELLNQVIPYTKKYSYVTANNNLALYKSTFTNGNSSYVKNLITPYIIDKTATSEQSYSYRFGWDYYKQCTMDRTYCTP